MAISFEPNQSGANQGSQANPGDNQVTDPQATATPTPTAEATISKPEKTEPQTPNSEDTATPETKPEEQINPESTETPKEVKPTKQPEASIDSNSDEQISLDLSGLDTATPTEAPTPTAQNENLEISLENNSETESSEPKTQTESTEVPKTENLEINLNSENTENTEEATKPTDDSQISLDLSGLGENKPDETLNVNSVSELESIEKTPEPTPTEQAEENTIKSTEIEPQTTEKPDLQSMEDQLSLDLSALKPAETEENKTEKNSLLNVNSTEGSASTDQTPISQLNDAEEAKEESPVSETENTDNETEETPSSPDATEPDLQMDLPKTTETKTDDDWIQEDSTEKKEEKTENENTENNEDPTDQSLSMPNLNTETNTENSLEMPTETPNSTVAVNSSFVAPTSTTTESDGIVNAPDKSGLDLSAISKAKVAESDANNPANTQTSQGFDLDSMISQMQQTTTAATTASVAPSVTPTESVPTVTPTVAATMSMEQAPTTSPIPGQMPMQPQPAVPTPTVAVVPDPVIPEASSGAIQASQVHKKGIAGKIIALVVLMLILAGFLLKTMFPAEINNFFDKLSGKETVPEFQMPSQEEIDAANLQVLNSGSTDNDTEEIVEDSENNILSGTDLENHNTETTTEENLSGDTNTGHNGADMENPFADLDEMLDDMPVDPKIELIAKLKEYKTQGDDYLELGELTEDATIIRYATVLSTVPEEDIALLESGEEVDMEQIDSHIKRFDLYLEKLTELVGETTPEIDPTAPLEVEEPEATVSVEALMEQMGE